MIKRILSLMVITIFLVSCGNGGNKEEKSTGTTDNTVAEVQFTSLIETPDNFIEKEIVIEGKVVHVCQHTGKKMFIVGENPDIRLFISAGEEVPLFEQDLLGSEIVVEGFLTRVEAGEKGMGEGEHEGMGEGESEGMAEEAEMSGEACETEAAVEAQPVLADFVLKYKSHTIK